MTTTLEKILSRSDRGQDVQTISDALDVSTSYVYATLREHRPKRARKPRRTTSDKPKMIAGLAKMGFGPAQVAKDMGVSRTYVYRWWPR